MEVRILSMESEYYLVLLVRTHLSFSLRHAIIETLSQSRLEQIDDMRQAINSYAQSIREIIGVPLMQDLERGDSIDWMKVFNAHSFTTLFSVRGMVHWIACHFHQKYPLLTHATLEGFGELDLLNMSPSGTYILSCINYDKNVDSIIMRSDGNKKKKKKQRKSPSGGKSRSGPPTTLHFCFFKLFV